MVAGRPFMARKMPVEIARADRAAAWPSAFSRSSGVLGQNHLAHGVDVIEEHVLGAAQADALGAEGDGLRA